jgi:pyridoxal 5'-phosphate synthase pdxS subunit
LLFLILLTLSVGYYNKASFIKRQVILHSDRNSLNSQTNKEFSSKKIKIRRYINMNQRYELNKNLAQMLKGGVIMDVTTPEQARIAQAAGACAVMALERIPADIRAAGGVSRMSDPKMIKSIQEAVSIPVMAKVRIGHFAEAQILEAIEIDYIDESEVLSPADDTFHIDKSKFNVPFVCGAKDLGEALRRINEGASMIRTKGEPGTGDVVQAVRHIRLIMQQIRQLQNMREDELFNAAKELQVPYDLVRFVYENGKLPVVNFAAGGVATPADAALLMQLGAEGVFVGSGIFKSGNPAKRAQAIVKAVTNYNDPKVLAELSEDLGDAMVGINEQEIELLMAQRGI